MIGRRFAVYFSWSRSKEIAANLGVLENRYPTLFEFRRAIWPMYEWASKIDKFDQGIAGFLDHVILFDFEEFSKVVQSEVGTSVEVIQREANNPPVSEWDDDFFRSIDTLIVVSLDHVITEQKPTDGEVEALKNWLAQEGKCLIVCPHHDVGNIDDVNLRQEEFVHHGDRLVPSQQRIGGFARYLLEQLDLPIENHYGLNPAASADGSPAPLQVFRDIDKLGVLSSVETFNLHPHLPHLSVDPNRRGEVKILARQKVNPAASSHPFVRAGNREFNSFIWVPPSGLRAGNVFVCDATLWSAAFQGTSSLKALWRNLANMKI